MVKLSESLARGSNWFGGVRLVAYPCSVLLAATSVLAFAPAAEGGPRAKAPVTWSWNGKDAWLPSGKAPRCGNVRLQPPAQVAALDGWLPPGRLNETARYYKAHGALRFADPSANGTVAAAVDGYVVRGAAYRENRDGLMNGPGRRFSTWSTFSTRVDSWCAMTTCEPSARHSNGSSIAVFRWARTRGQPM